MFQDSLLETGADAGRRRVARVISFAFETLLVAVVIVLPLLQSVALPRLTSTFLLGTPPPPRSSVRAASATHSGTRTTNVAPLLVLRAPAYIPRTIDLSVRDPEPGPPGIPGAIPGFGPGDPNGVPYGFASVLPPPPLVARPTLPPPPRVKVSAGVSQGNLVHQVQPAYPPLAITARIQGSVVLAAVIARDGRIENLRVLSGPPMLVKAALDAVSQWRYRPYLLNSEPVEVETQITVNFKLGGG